MNPLLSPADYKLRSALPTEYVDAIETRTAGFTAQQLVSATAEIYGALSKRYATPFAVDHEMPRTWATWIVDAVVLTRRGVDPDELGVEVDQVFARAALAREQLQAAANAETGLFELPLRLDDPTSPSGVSRGGPLSYSEQSPYAWTSQQRELGREDDANGRGRR